MWIVENCKKWNDMNNVSILDTFEKRIFNVECVIWFEKGLRINS